MRSGGNDFNYFKLTKLANFVQFKRMPMFFLEDWGLGSLAPGYATVLRWNAVAVLGPAGGAQAPSFAPSPQFRGRSWSFCKDDTNIGFICVSKL